MLDNQIELIGDAWLIEQIEALTDEIEHLKPSDFNERARYLPDSVTPRPGFMSFDVNPYMREIVDCCDPRSPVREVNLKKGVQITYSTMLESVLLYYIAHIKTRPSMMVSADRELVKGRIENYILPMLQQSDLAHLIQSSDEGNSRKTGKTSNHLQWAGGGFLIPGGANNADKMRMYSIMLMLKDEIDAWPDVVGKDGDPDKLTDDRCSAFWETRKIYRGGTPLIKGSSKIQHQFERGDQRVYKVRCKSCGFPQALRWHHVNKDNGVIGGFSWETDQGVLVQESVRYLCQNCGHPHHEYDKTRLFSPDHGAEWVPTSRPVSPGIRSYHLPAFYSPADFKPWHGLVSDYLDAYDTEERKVKDIGRYQIFYNNVLGEPFEVMGSKVQFTQVSAHRRSVYRAGTVPNTYATEYSGSHVLFLVCTVDVHKTNLAVSVFGVCRDARLYLIEYQRIEDEDCTDPAAKCWSTLRDLVSEKEYEGDDGKIYPITLTMIDAGYANDTVSDFCASFEGGVFAVLGRERPAKNQQIKEFAPFTTQSGSVGYRVLVDHYKDRMAPVLRREWQEDDGPQKPYHFNAPVDISDKALKELTVETKREKKDERGNVSFYWHRPQGADNELWDLTGYCFAAVEIYAHAICIDHFELKTVNWPQFWDFIEQEGRGQFYR